MGGTTSLRFASAAQALSAEARRLGLTAPQFRSPPRGNDVDRTIRRGSPAVVSVRVRNRPFAAVAADMIEGVIIANELSGGDALRVRSSLWERLAAEDEGLAA